MENREKIFFKCLNIECKKKLIIEKLCRVEKICGGGQIYYTGRKKGGGGGLLLPCLAFGGVAFGKIAPNKVKHPTK